MRERSPGIAAIDQRVDQLFTLVSEALAGATVALLAGDLAVAQAVVDGDSAIDEITTDLDQLVWNVIETDRPAGLELRTLVSVLLILPELERSADLAEHIAQRAVRNLGVEMSPASRGIVQRMSEVASEMWSAAADAFADRSAQSVEIDGADEELDILRDRLTAEVATGAMPAATSAQVALLGRFYERLGDHAVNLARRVESLRPRGSGEGD
jgi:phosphate transport system protein